MSGNAPSPQSPIVLSQQETRALQRATRILEKHFFTTPDFAVRSRAAVADYLRFKFAGLGREEFHALWLDAHHRLIAMECLFVGTLTHTAVYPREVVKCALKHNACAVIFCHNHPSGNVTPSLADQVMTRQLKNALQLIDVRVLDHFVVTAKETVSIEEFAYDEAKHAGRKSARKLGEPGLFRFSKLRGSFWGDADQTGCIKSAPGSPAAYN
jgi:DNA repair protein RadC